MRNSIGKLIGGSLIGAAAGFFGPMLLMSANPLSGVVGAWLYAWAGIVPAGVFALVGLYTANLLGGGAVAAGFALSVLVPMVVALVCIRMQMSYKTCSRVSVFVQIGAVVVTLGAAWLYTRTDLVDLLMSNMEATFALLPYDMLNQLLNPNAAQTAGGIILGAQELQARLQAFLDSVGEVFKIGLPGMLLSNCLLAGILNVAAPVWVWARRGDERGIRRVPVSEWRLPESAAIGMPVCLVLGIILNYAGYPGGDSVNYAVQMVFQTLLQIQCMGAFSRLAKRAGSSRLMRGLLVFGALTFAAQIAVYLGAYSLYFGSQGLISTFIRNRNKNQEGDE